MADFSEVDPAHGALASDDPSSESTMELSREIERKFLVPAPPGGFEATSGKPILQGYLAVTTEGTEVRLRRKGDAHFLTVKGKGGLIRLESEIQLTRDQFETLWPNTAGRRLEKVRFSLPWEGREIDFDVYGGRLHGLMTAEVEFPSVRASREFVPPPWFGEEVTEDSRYKNRNLALKGRPREGGASSG